MQENDCLGLEELLLRDHFFRKDQLHVFFDDVGIVIIDGWEHFHVTRKLDKDKAEALYLEMYERFGDKAKRIKSRTGDIVRVLGPVNLVEELPEHFIRGNYKTQVNWRFGFPGCFLGFDKQLVDALNQVSILKKDFESYYHQLDQEVLSGKKQSEKTRIRNKIDNVFLDYHGKNLNQGVEDVQKKTSANLLPIEILERRAALATRVSSMDDLLKKQDLGLLRFTKNRFYEIETHLSSPSLVKSRRVISANELRNTRILFIDIEFPRYDEDDVEISWIGMKYVHQDKKICRIYTLRDTGSTEVEGYEIIRCQTEPELIRASAGFIQETDPLLVTPFNAKVDIYMPKEVSAFPIAREQRMPVKDAVVYDRVAKQVNRFLDDIGIKGRFLVDLMRVSKIALSFLPHQNLKSVAKYLLGKDMTKDYGLLKERETLAKSGDIEAALKLAEYLSDDVGDLEPILFETNFFEGLGLLSRVLNISIETLSEGSSRSTHFIEQEYFWHVGTYKRKKIPEMKDRDDQAMEKYFKWLEKDLCKRNGNDTNVKVLIPHHEFVRNALLWHKYPGLAEIYHKIGYGDLDDMTRILLAKHLFAIGKEILVDFSNYRKMRKDKGILEDGQETFFSDEKDAELSNLEERFSRVHRYTLPRLESDIEKEIQKLKQAIMDAGFRVSKARRNYLSLGGKGDLDELRARGYIVVEL